MGLFMVNYSLGSLIFAILFASSCTHIQDTQNHSVSTIADDACVHDTVTFRCVKYFENHDGDTITVDIPNVHPLLGKKISVRINGIDTPELKSKKPCEKDVAMTAKILVESKLKVAKQIDLYNVKRDKYFRILADVSADQILIKDLLLKSKLAYEYNGGTKQDIDWCTFAR